MHPAAEQPAPAGQPPFFSKERLRRTEASVYLRERHGVSVAVPTLAKFATRGGGPVYEKFGRIPLYRRTELDRWVEQRMSPPMRSSADIKAKHAA